MANGLLDFFGKDYEDPRTQGLLQFGLGLMQQGGYQDRPVSLGQAMGAAGQQGMGAYQQAVAEKQRKEQLIQQKAMQDLQMQQMQQAMAAQREQQELARQQRERTAAQRSLVMQGLGAGGAEGLALPRDKAGERPMDTQLALAMAMGQDPTQALTYLAGADERRRAAKLQEQAIERGDIDIAQSQEVAVPLPMFEKNENINGVLGVQSYRFEPEYGDKGEVKKYNEVRVGAFVPTAEALKEIVPDGRLIDKKTGKHLGRSITVDGAVKLLTDDNKILDLKEGSFTKVTEAYWEKEQTDPEKMAARQLEITEQEKTLTQLNNYLEITQADGQDGFELLVNRLTGSVNAFLGKDLTQEQLNAALQGDKLNALIGRIREDVVGGGVMTEQDALRVISALGGDVSAWRSPARVKAAISDVLQSKEATLRAEVSIYNRAVDFAPEGRYQRIGVAPASSAVVTPAPAVAATPAVGTQAEPTADEIVDMYSEVE